MMPKSSKPHKRSRWRGLVGCGIVGLICTLACGGGDKKPQGSRADRADRAAGTGSAGSRNSGRPAGSERGGGLFGPGGAAWGGAGSSAAVPVEAAIVLRREISSFIETNGTLEAENEVDLVSRVAAPVVLLNVEEGDRVDRGDLLARLDDEEIRAKAGISRANLNESRLALERAERLHEASLISPEDYEQALTRFDTSRAQFESDQIELGYTEIRAPFSGLIIGRYVNFAEQVSPNSRLFRISDFDPLLCPIQVPERDLSKVELDQSAYLTVEAWPDQRFAARVLRISPIVDATTGTIKVTLAVESVGLLRPGMFASVFLKTETRSGALVIPRAALSLDSIGDTVYVAANGTAQRREVELGFQEGDLVEVVRGLEPGESIVVVGQDGLSDGTPIRVLSAMSAMSDTTPDVGKSPDQVHQEEYPQAPPRGESETPRGRGGFPGRRGGGPPDFSKMSPEQVQRIRVRMKARGLTDAQIDERMGSSRKTRKEGGR